MRNLRRSSLLQQKKLMTSLVVLIGVLIFAFAAIPQSVHAGGGVGSGGGGGSGSGGAQSRNGWGWYDYASNDGVTPAGFRNGDSWSRVSNVCSSASADRVIAFIALKQSGTDASTGVVYDYHSSWDGFQGYRGDAGNGWLPTSTAKSYYDSIDVDKTGFTWGDNVAWFCYSTAPPTPTPWSLSASSTADRSSAAPGDTIHWTHTLRNDGPGATTETIHSNLSITGFSNGWGGSGEWSAGDTGAGAGVGTIRTLTDYATYTVQDSDLGNTLCEKVQYDPANSSGARDGRGNNSCVSVPYEYILTPSVTTNPSGVIETGSQFSIYPVVNNSGPTSSKATDWTLVRTITGSGTNDGTSDVANGNNVFRAGITPNPTYSATADYRAGTHICFALTVKPHSASDTSEFTSPSACLIVSKKPKFQMWGGSLWTNGSVTTSTSVKDVSGVNNTFGSWDEYGIFSVGMIKGMASASALAGSGLGNATVCAYSTLSFTNAGSSTNCSANQSAGGIIGNYANSRTIPDVAASFPVSGSTPTVVPNLNNLQGIYTASGSVTINGGNIQKDQWIVINAPSATITIAGNINYTNGNLNNIGDIPQVVIIANRIIINSNVTNVDSWLITKDDGATSGAIYTCDVLGDTVNKCNQPLVVNGPVMTNKLFLRRTAGSGTGAASGDPAEIFNIRADAYLWSASRAAVSGRIQTVYTTELPPRF